MSTTARPVRTTNLRCYPTAYLLSLRAGDNQRPPQPLRLGWPLLVPRCGSVLDRGIGGPGRRGGLDAGGDQVPVGPGLEVAEEAVFADDLPILDHLATDSHVEALARRLHLPLAAGRQ